MAAVDKIEPTTNDMYGLSNIFIKSIESFNKIGIFILNPQAKVGNLLIKDTIDKDLVDLLDSVSVSKKFSS